MPDIDAIDPEADTPLTEDQLQRVLSALRAARNLERARLVEIRGRLRDEIQDLYIPEEATDEFRIIVEQSRFNILRLVLKQLAQGLFVDGYRSVGPDGRSPSPDNAEVWGQVWQPNRMDKRQGGVHKAAGAYGYSFLTVLPGDPAPTLTPYSPFRLNALYADPVNDEFPVFAMTVDHPDALAGARNHLMHPLVPPEIAAVLGYTKVRVWDAWHVYTLRIPVETGVQPQVEKVDRHGLGHCPVVRFLDEYDTDGETRGVIEPLIPLQKQINQTTFSLAMTTNYQSFRQRWVTGLAMETDDDGNPIAPWNAAVDSVWTNESPDARFGEFAEANLTQFLETRDRQLMGVSATGQVAPHAIVLGAGISNISAEALAALGASSEGDKVEHQTTLGESWEQAIRLGALANNDRETWEDRSGQVVWRDTTPRSLAQIADALGKLATLLGVPPEGLWERIPGATQQDLDLWKALKERNDVEAELARMEAEEAALDDEDDEDLDDEESAGGGPAPGNARPPSGA